MGLHGSDRICSSRQSLGFSTVTEEQQKVVDDATASIADAYADARSRVSEAGVDLGGEPEGTPCRKCGCKSFVLGTGGGLICTRTHPAPCGHHFTSHDVF
ncbi:hypothetical protein OG429_38495 [Streptomyces sp. NBC_00190]|uniref:DUF6422 family protein n=1 Tax=unclassified Streptomyces TaxID=2593676 RepID=UPI002E282A77|nr:DUF6422 family protein [Streptomyces sp. NBC_00190]